MTRIRTIDAGSGQQAGRRAVRRGGRRGVLLLIVLSMLTLFMMLGVAYLVAATRARTAARAYAKLTFGADDARIPVAPLLDDVLLRVIRGPAPTVLALGTDFESLLEDRYGRGTTLSGTANVTTTTSSPILTGTLTLTSGSLRPTDLAGRVLTFVEPGRVATSHRIVRASTASNNNAPDTAFTVTLDKPFRSDRAVPPTGQQAKVVVNGREFSGGPSNESWDGFDAENPFLARVAPDPTLIANSTVTKGSYLSSAPATTDHDNDGDGVPDSQFFSWDLPSFNDAAGNRVTVDAAVLIVDLDGRFNVNAHGSLAPTLYPDNHLGWTAATGISGTSLNDAPLGSGYGPADIQFNMATGTMASGTSGSPKLFDTTAWQSGENPRLSITVGDIGTRQTGLRPAGSRYGEAAPTPRLGRVDGKYGERAAADTTITTALKVGSATLPLPRPGEPNFADDASQLTDRHALSTEAAPINRGVPPIWWDGTAGFNWHTLSGQPDPRGVFNAPPDLHGRMKTLTLTASGSSVVPQLVYAKPEWDDGTGALGAETKDDPYELLLDTRRGVGGWNRDQTSSNNLRHNPFTLPELEPVLRPYDGDTNRQPQRLTTMLGTDAEASRLKFTTESWDTTTITGSAAQRIYGNGNSASPSGWLQTIPGTNTTALSGTTAVTGLLSGEVARGEKFDLNRAFDPSDPGNAGYAPTQPYFVQRQAYFKDLYTLLVALQSGTGALPAGDAEDLAQWAANVVKFRDADSRIIPFEYEQDVKANGWLVNNDVGDPGSGATADPATRRVVWPAVRPEIVIREVLAWHNSDPGVTGAGKSGMVISLHRPWNAKAYASGPTNIIDAEPCDYALDTLVNASGTPQATGRPSNQVDLGKKADGSVLGSNLAEFNNIARTHYPIWRLRIAAAAGPTYYVRFDTDTAGANEIVIPSVTNGATKPRLASDSTLTLYSGTTMTVGAVATGTAPAVLDVMKHGDQTLTAPNLHTVAAAMTSGTVFLERLSDPSITLTETGPVPGTLDSGNAPEGQDIWDGKDTVLGPPDKTQVPVRYVVVDSMPFTVTPTQPAVPPAPLPIQTSRRATAGPTAFWKSVSGPAAAVNVPDTPPPPVPGALAPGDTAWFVWPNRPFVSAAELVLVPQGDSQAILKSYQRPDPTNWATIGVPLVPAARGLLFDCVHAPTRFSSVHTTTTNDHSGQSGVYPITTPVNQLSAYREPGRVNLNTITSDDVWNTVVAGPLNEPVVTGSTAGLGIPASSNKTVKTMLEAIDLESGGTDAVKDTPVDFPQIHRNPAHAIYTATRLANTVTTRSNVFAVWITLREYVGTSPNDDPDSVRYHRGFYIVDRSIPVGFQVGQDHNVWDCVRLRRVIE